ncbi:MAG: PEP-CTERM sorting domain-containing protein [Pyrinomonadaceae bacterium]
MEDPELSSTDSNENELDLANISSDLLEDPELSSTDSNEYELDLAGISSDLLEDSELSSTDSNEYELDLAGISSDLLEDPELASEDNNSLASQTKNPDDDALPAEAVPEPTKGLGTLLALSGLGLLKKLKNRKTKE